MKSSQNSTSQRSYIFTSLSNKVKLQSKTKLQCHLVTMIISATTPNRCIASTTMVVKHRRIGKRILDHHHNKEVKEPSSKDQFSIITERVCQVEGTDVGETPAHSGLHTACTMVVKLTIAQDCPIFLESKRKMEQDSNQCPQ
jgi:hypothetical protein